MPSSFLPPMPMLTIQVLAALLWIAGYVAWCQLYYRVLDPWLRRLVGACMHAEVIWVYRVGSFHGGGLSFTRWSAWSWGLAGERTETTIREAAKVTLRDYAIYASFLVLVPILAGLWPIAGLLYVTLWRHALVVVVLLPLLFIVGPLYVAYWSFPTHGRHPGGVAR